MSLDAVAGLMRGRLVIDGRNILTSDEWIGGIRRRRPPLPATTISAPNHAFVGRSVTVRGTVALLDPATLVVSGMRPQYRGTASILIEQGKSKVVSIEEVAREILVG
mgnify:CR=1 FL=1